MTKVLTKGTTTTSKSIGTPGFQPREQLKAGKINASVDVYALGCVLVELFGGKQIWQGLSAIQIMVKVAVEGEVAVFSHLPESVQPVPIKQKLTRPTPPSTSENLLPPLRYHLQYITMLCLLSISYSTTLTLSGISHNN